MNNENKKNEASVYLGGLRYFFNVPNYQVRVCQCGRIHMIPYNEIYYKCLNKGKCFLIVCANCGETLIVGRYGSERPNDTMPYVVSDNTAIDMSDVGGIHIDSGLKVYLKGCSDAANHFIEQTNEFVYMKEVDESDMWSGDVNMDRFCKQGGGVSLAKLTALETIPFPQFNWEEIKEEENNE